MAQKSSELNDTETTNSDAIDTTEDQMSGADNTTASGTNDQNFVAPEIADDPDEIRQQIEETRASMSETIDAIGEKLSVANISEQVKEQVSEQIDSALETVKDKAYEATVGKAESFIKTAGDVAGNFIKNTGDAMKNTSQKISKSQFFKSAQDSPLPLVLIGLGVGLLAYRSFGDKKQTAGYSAASGGNDYGKRSFQSSKKSALSSAQEKIGDAVGSAYDSVSETASGAYKGAGDLASQTYKKIGDLGSQAQSQYSRQIEENPLVVGAVAAAVGAAIGLSIPATSYENKLMGEARQNLLQKAQDSTGDLIGKVKNFVNDAGKTIGDEVKNQLAEQPQK